MIRRRGNRRHYDYRVGTKPRFFLCKNRWISENRGRSLSCVFQHSSMRSKISFWQEGGRGRYFCRPSFWYQWLQFSITCSLVNSAYGLWLQWTRISHRVTANDHTSLFVVFLPCGQTNNDTVNVCTLMMLKLNAVYLNLKDIKGHVYFRPAFVLLHVSEWSALLLPMYYS